MATARQTYATTVASAAMAKAAADLQAEMIKQETINASRCNVGYTLQTGNYTNLASAAKNANAAKAATDVSNEQGKQTTINGARSTLQATGDLGPG